MPQLTFILGIALAAAIPLSRQSTVRILSECNTGAEVRAQVPRDSPVELHFAIAGSPTCYSVTTRVDGREVRGFVLGEGLDATVKFDQGRVTAEQDAFRLAPTPMHITPPVLPSATGGTPDAIAGKAKNVPKPVKSLKKPPEVEF